ncbi:MAG: magnesium-protoporphyrin IX monomethyl ester (oxidative) cyclase, partial [Myxococcota bacterium]
RCMARDEARHAGFINDALKDFDIGVDLGFLTKKKQYTFFRPKFIFYATYLSEKIGYARYIKVFRHLEANPQYKFHPIFNWFEEWCTDEFTHGEAFALLMRADPKLLSGFNRVWIRFFQLAVLATMWVRDHRRVLFHEALGLDPTEYGMEVFELTREISKQVFPVLLDIENPKFRQGLDRLQEIDVAISAAEEKGGVWNRIRVLGLKARAGVTFVRMLMLKTRENTLPEASRLYPVW